MKYEYGNGGIWIEDNNSGERTTLSLSADEVAELRRWLDTTYDTAEAKRLQAEIKETEVKLKLLKSRLTKTNDS